MMLDLIQSEFVNLIHRSSFYNYHGYTSEAHCSGTYLFQ